MVRRSMLVWTLLVKMKSVQTLQVTAPKLPSRRGAAEGAWSQRSAGRSQFREVTDAGDGDGAPHRATGRRAELP